MSTPTQKKAIKELTYEEFIASLQFYAIGLAETTCSIDRDEYWGKDESKRIGYKLLSKASSIKDENFDVRSTLSLSMKGEQSDIEVVNIHVSFELHFHARVVRKEFVDQFCGSEIR